MICVYIDTRDIPYSAVVFAAIAACENDNVLVFELSSRYFKNVNEIYIDTVSIQGMTPLGAAIRHRSYRIIDYLLNPHNDLQGVDKQYKDKIQKEIDVSKYFSDQYESPLTLAASMLDVRIVKLLLNHPRMTKNDVNMHNLSRCTPIDAAVFRISDKYKHKTDKKFDESKALKVVSLLLDDKRVNGNGFVLECPDDLTPLRIILKHYAEKKDKFLKQILLKFIKCPRVCVNKQHLLFARQNKMDKEIIFAICKNIN